MAWRVFVSRATRNAPRPSAPSPARRGDDDGGERARLPPTWACAGVPSAPWGCGPSGLNRYESVFPVTVLSATTSVKSRIMAEPGACLPTRGSHAQGAREASSFSTRDILRFLGSP